MAAAAPPTRFHVFGALGAGLVGLGVRERVEVGAGAIPANALKVLVLWIQDPAGSEQNRGQSKGGLARVQDGSLCRLEGYRYADHDRSQDRTRGRHAQNR